MWRQYVISAAVVLAAALVAPFAQAGETPCGQRDKFLKHLGAKYDEAPRALGLTVSGAMLELLTSKEGSWTILVTNPKGDTCVVAAGNSWEFLLPQLLGPAA